MSITSKSAPPPEDDCPLAVPLQQRNILLYGLLWAFIYLAAPVVYVGVTHSSFLKQLGQSDTTCNLPASMYQWVAALPIIVAWMFPNPRLAKPLLVACLTGTAAISGLVAVMLWFRIAPEYWVKLFVAHGLILGITNGLGYPAMWEILRRGVASSRRGAVMGLAFGLGPVLACLGSLGQQFILTGGAHGIEVGHLEFPGNFALLFGLGAPVSLMAALCSTFFVVPETAGAAEESPGIEAIFQGLKEFVLSRPVFLGVICYLLVYAGGNSIMQTVSLAAPERIAGVSWSAVTGKSESQQTVGYQNELRFGFKAVAGVLLGWLLAKTHPKAALLATTATLIVAMFWALSVTGNAYLISMGLLGAGELFGAYYPNYVVSASPKHRVRLNVAYLTMLSSLIGFAPVMFGKISDVAGRRASMLVATGILLAMMAVVSVGLPKDPRPTEAQPAA